jgi:hypothetical protein
VGVPPSLYDVSPQAQQLVQLVAAVQAETFTYARYASLAYCVPHLMLASCISSKAKQQREAKQRSKVKRSSEAKHMPL